MVKEQVHSVFFRDSLITVVMHWTTSMHGLYYRNIHLESLGNLSVLAFDRGFFYWLQFLYLNFAILTGFFLFYTSYREHKGLQKKQFKIILVGSAMPWLIMVLYTAGVGPKGVDLNPFRFYVFRFDNRIRHLFQTIVRYYSGCFHNGLSRYEGGGNYS